MSRRIAALALALGLLAGLAAACGRYGRPQRSEPPAPPEASAPITDSGVPR